MKKCNKENWQERMNAQGCNKVLNVQNVHGAALKRTFAICNFSNNVVCLRNNKDISRKELKFKVSNFIKICTKSPAFLGIANMKIQTFSSIKTQR